MRTHLRCHTERVFPPPWIWGELPHCLPHSGVLETLTQVAQENSASTSKQQKPAGAGQRGILAPVSLQCWPSNLVKQSIALFACLFAKVCCSVWDYSKCPCDWKAWFSYSITGWHLSTCFTTRKTQTSGSQWESSSWSFLVEWTTCSNCGAGGSARGGVSIIWRVILHKMWPPAAFQIDTKIWRFVSYQRLPLICSIMHQKYCHANKGNYKIKTKDLHMTSLLELCFPPTSNSSVMLLSGDLKWPIDFSVNTAMNTGSRILSSSPAACFVFYSFWAIGIIKVVFIVV